MYTSSSELSDDDMTEEMSQCPLSNPHVPSSMNNAGLLCGNGIRDMPYHGLLPAQVQDMWRSFNPNGWNHQESLVFTSDRFAMCLDNLAFDARKIAQNAQKRGDHDVDFKTDLANMGFQAIALGLWATLFGPYGQKNIFEIIEKVCNGAKHTDTKHMTSWLLGLSMGMECHDMNQSPSWRLIQHSDPLDVEIIPGWPNHSIRIPTPPRTPSAEAFRNAIDVDDSSSDDSSASY